MPNAHTGTKRAAPIAMLSAPNGATIDEIMAPTGQQSHRVMGALASALKELGLTITPEKFDRKRCV